MAAKKKPAKAKKQVAVKATPKATARSAQPEAKLTAHAPAAPKPSAKGKPDPWDKEMAGTKIPPRGTKPPEPVVTSAKAPKGKASAKQAAPAKSEKKLTAKSPAGKAAKAPADRTFTLTTPISRAELVIHAPTLDAAITKARAALGDGFDVDGTDLGLSSKDTLALDFEMARVGRWLTAAERTAADKLKVGSEVVFRLPDGTLFRAAGASEEGHLFSRDEKGIQWKGRLVADPDGVIEQQWKDAQK